MRIEPAPPFGTDAAPLAEQQGVPEQVGPDFHAVEAELVALGADADQRRGFREERKLDRGGPRGFGAFGHDVGRIVSGGGAAHQQNRHFRAKITRNVIQY